MEVLHLLFLVAVASAASYREEDPPCGLPKFRGPRIVEGYDATEGQFPWAVSIQSDDEHICGGAILKQRTILTAGHCVDMQHVKGMNPEAHALSVVLGTRNLSNMFEGVSQRIKFTKVTFHQNYEYFPSTQRTSHDIAIIELDEDIQWSPLASPVCLPPYDILFGVKDFPARVSGWGQLWGKPYPRSLQGFSEVLQTAPLNVYSNDQCNFLYGRRKFAVPFSIQPFELCAGLTEISPSGKADIQAAVTNRDSGSPLVVKFNDRWTIVGVVKSIPQSAGPGIYSRVSSYLPWINSS